MHFRKKARNLNLNLNFPVRRIFNLIDDKYANTKIPPLLRRTRTRKLLRKEGYAEKRQEFFKGCEADSQFASKISRCLISSLIGRFKINAVTQIHKSFCFSTSGRSSFSEHGLRR